MLLYERALALCGMHTFLGRLMLSGFGVWANWCTGEWENGGNNSPAIVATGEEEGRSISV
jgi:hypothetical protein